MRKSRLDVCRLTRRSLSHVVGGRPKPEGSASSGGKTDFLPVSAAVQKASVEQVSFFLVRQPCRTRPSPAPTCQTCPDLQDLGSI